MTTKEEPLTVSILAERVTRRRDFPFLRAATRREMDERIQRMTSPAVNVEGTEMPKYHYDH